jgi:hypothetical protein
MRLVRAGAPPRGAAARGQATLALPHLNLHHSENQGKLQMLPAHRHPFVSAYVCRSSRTAARIGRRRGQAMVAHR